MGHNQFEKTIAYCGLVCGLCNTEGTCNCKTGNHCGKRLSPDGCFQYTCCREKGIEGCWECADAPCGKDMFAPKKVKLRAFIRCMKEDGIGKFSEYISRNAENGVVYHRAGILGDYDLDTEEEVLTLLRTGK